MPGKSTHSGQHLPTRGGSGFPADAEEIHLGLYRRKAATLSLPDGGGRQGNSGRRQTAPHARTFVEITYKVPAPSLLAMELSRVEKALDNHAADARQRDDLPECWIRT